VNCPDCGHENLPGDDLCADCGGDLTALDRPEEASKLAANLLGMEIAKLPPRESVIVLPQTPLYEVLGLMAELHIGCVLVGALDDIVGIFSERDFLMRASSRYSQLADAPVSEFMSSDPVMLQAEDPVAFALHRMQDGDYRHLPIMRDNQLAGVISLRDVLGVMAKTYPELLATPG